MGAISGMIISLKNNKRTRKSALEKLKQHNYLKDTNNDRLLFSKTVTEDQLQHIRKEIKKENRKRFLRYIFFFGTATLIILIAIGFVKF